MADQKKRIVKALECNCDEAHTANGTRAGGPVALWTCPRHGNVFEEVPGGITLTAIQRNVLQAISDEYKAGRTAGWDDISKKLNYSTWKTREAFNILQSLNFIEGA